jgi:hypothetical protein
MSLLHSHLFGFFFYEQVCFTIDYATFSYSRIIMKVNVNFSEQYFPCVFVKIALTLCNTPARSNRQEVEFPEGVTSTWYKIQIRKVQFHFRNYGKRPDYGPVSYYEPGSSIVETTNPTVLKFYLKREQKLRDFSWSWQLCGNNSFQGKAPWPIIGDWAITGSLTIHYQSKIFLCQIWNKRVRSW